MVFVIGVVTIPRLRSRSLKERFGTEYDRLVDEEGDRRSAEAELGGRVKRRGTLQIRRLEPTACEAYAEQRPKTQQRFIDGSEGRGLAVGGIGPERGRDFTTRGSSGR